MASASRGGCDAAGFGAGGVGVGAREVGVGVGVESLARGDGASVWARDSAGRSVAITAPLGVVGRGVAAAALDPASAEVAGETFGS